MKFRNTVFGIALGLATLASGPSALIAQGPPPPGYEPWSAPPQEYQRDVERQGFHDGVEGARKDFQNHRQPNVENRDEYRHPRFGGADRHPYRDAFRRGYEVGVQNIYSGGPR